MSIAEADARALGRVRLLEALRAGDLVAAARAWDRLRVSGATLAPAEAAAARAARAAVGRAIRDARYRRSRTRFWSPLPRPIFEPQPGGTGLRKVALAVAVMAVVAVVLTLPPLLNAAAPPPPPLAQEEVVEVDSQVPVAIPLSAGRGRTQASPAPAAAAEPSAEPDESASAAPTATARRTARPRGTGGAASGEAGGVPGGVEGGTGSTVGASPGPTLNILPLVPPPVEPESVRITFIVVDGETLKPLAAACVVLGTGTCTPDKPHTNARGMWWRDLPRKGAALLWDFRFFMEGYVPAQVQLTHTGNSRVIQVRLRPR